MKQQKGNIQDRDHNAAAIAKATSDFHARIEKTGVTHYTVRRFRNIIYSFYRENARGRLPWRNTDNPYHILISEIMLQQTQIERVLHKYPLLIKKYPDFASLANARLRSLYAVWQGMGYNRRALALKETARKVMSPPYNGTLPSSVEELMSFPGIGRATACAVAAFAFHQPVVFIETNIRRVFIHFFFPDSESVTDNDIFPLIEKTLDNKDPRHWYYALMDYGSMLRKVTVNPNRKSRAYKKQPPFTGSNRQLRGQILRLVLDRGMISEKDLAVEMPASPEKLREAVEQLCREGFIRKYRNVYRMV